MGFGQLERASPERAGRDAAQLLRDVRELLDREGEETPRRSRPLLPQVVAGRGELDQPLQVAPAGAGGTGPDGLPLLVGLEEPVRAEGGEAAREAVRVGPGVGAQAFGRAERIRSIS